MDLEKSLATDFGATGKGSTFLHGEDLGLDVAVDAGLVVQFAALGGDFAFDLAVDLHFAGGDVAIDGGILADGHLAFVGGDFTFDFTIDDHVIAETDGTGDFDAAG